MECGIPLFPQAMVKKLESKILYDQRTGLAVSSLPFVQNEIANNSMSLKKERNKILSRRKDI